MTPSLHAPHVAILVLNWNGLDFTAACIRSLLRLETRARMSILVIDNGSTAHTPDMLRKACPGATILPLPENLGFAGGMNAGIREAMASSPDFIWLLNNDTICEPTALDSLLRPMEGKQVGLVSSRMTQGASGQDGADGALPLVHRGGLSLRPPLYVPYPPRGTGTPDFLSGASLLIRTAALRQIGPLDEGFPFFFEDADYSYRAKAKGWALAETSAADVIHMGSATIGRMSLKKARCYRLGHVRFLRRHGRFPFLSSLPAFFWRLLADGLRLDGAAMLGTLQGWRDGWKGDLSVVGDLP